MFARAAAMAASRLGFPGAARKYAELHCNLNHTAMLSDGR